ncbi:MAG: mucoidy inhibitor MuiA family protein [Pelomonas sp.]|nr:mucoidy inhibitor MuiA family protein [Roseateles sp.]
MRSTVVPALLALASPLASQAQSPAHIEHVLVYPGGAVVERVVAVKAGQPTLTLGCLPTNFDADSLQVEGAGVRVAELSLQTVDRKAAPECSETPLEQRIRALQAQAQLLRDDINAADLALAALKNVGQGVGAAQIGTATEAIKRNALQALDQQIQTREKLRGLDAQLAPLLAERERIAKANPQVAALRARVLAEHDAELHISTRTPHAGWQPYYRARLDTATGQLRLERHARVGQSTGEDWQGVRLVLSTTAPNEAVEGGTPGSWDLSLFQPQAEAKLMRTYAAAPAPASVMVSGNRTRADAAADFDVSVFNGAYASEFSLPVPVDVQSGSDKVALALGETALDAQLVARVTPAQQAEAYLVAEARRPDGFWPRGPLQLYRDGRYVGASFLNLDATEPLDLGFGRDAQLRVTVQPEDDNKGEAGFIGSRNSRHIVRRYALANHHDRAARVEVLEATPVARDDKIEVAAQLTPEPAAGDWRDAKGVRAWTFELAPGAEQKLSADYRITWPKDQALLGAR